ncbi:MAG: putative glycoside hydrolase [Gemmatimonadetes bacterium]|nr:putative glycoside hydrolase [Gemmatimonadota bacterium]
MKRLQFRSAWAWAALSLTLVACGGQDPEANAAGDGDSTVVAADSAAATSAAPAPASKAPAQIRGLYINAYAAGSKARLPKLIAMADSTEINTFVVDVKSERGIHYTSQVALATELQQQGENTLRDLKAFVDTLHAHNIYTMARIVIFKDPILSKARPKWSIKKADGGLWVDKAGNTWVSAWDSEVWDYNLDIAEEAARAGFDEIQFDYVRFPEPYASLPPQVHPEAKGDRTDAIAAFLNEAKNRLHPLGALVSADVFGLSPNDPDDVNIGQQWETIAATADHILPMMYPSHYLPVHLPGVKQPDLMPYETLYKSAGMARIRNDRLKEAGVRPARVIAWLQAFSATWLRNHLEYGPKQLQDQKRGVYDVGFEDWVLWHPGSKYEPILGGLERETQSRAKPTYTPPADVLAVVDLFEKQGVRVAREKASAQARGDTSDPAAAQAAKRGTAE